MKVVALSIGRLAMREQHLALLGRVGAAGTLTSPEAMARSSSAWLSAIERSDRLSVPMRLGDRDLLGDPRSDFERDGGEGLDLGLAVHVLAVDALVGREHAQVAQDRLGDLERRRRRRRPRPLGQHQVDPVAREDEAGDAVVDDTGTVTARMPGPSAAARKPRSSGPTSEPWVTAGRR